MKFENCRMATGLSHVCEGEAVVKKMFAVTSSGA